MKTRYLTFLLGASLGCATPGAQPHEMSAEQHEASAKQEDQAAAGHQAQYDSDATATQQRCTTRSGPAGRAGITPDVCWTSVTNPTETHRAEADSHRRHAADHRAGSAVLREAEARACVGITPEDRDLSPFEHPEDIERVAPMTIPDAAALGRGPTEGLVGAVVTFRAVPGLTAQWLQRVVDCHLARNAALGHVVPEMPNCPLVPDGITVNVSPTANGIAVTIRSNNPTVAREVLARAQRLLPAPTPKATSAR